MSIKKNNVNNWEEIKKRGLLRFILLEGSIKWGIPAGLIAGFIIKFKYLLEGDYLEFTLGVLYYTLIFFVFGWIYGIFMWFYIKRKEEKYGR